MSKLLQKDLTPVLGIVESILNASFATIHTCNAKPCVFEAEIQRPDQREFAMRLVTDERIVHDRGDYWSLELDLAGHTVQTDRAFLRTYNVNLAENHEEVYGFALLELKSGTLPVEPAFWRIILPMAEDIHRSRLHQLEHTWYDHEGTRSAGRIPVLVDGLVVELLFHSENNRHYLIYDVLVAMPIKDAQEHVHDIALALGYITGNFVQDECFCFPYPDEHMSGSSSGFFYSKLRDTIRSSYAPICRNPHSYLYGNKVEAERLEPLLRVLSTAEFSKLCQRVRSDDHFAAHLLLILESMAASVVAMPPGLCVALEGITKAPSTAKVSVKTDPLVHAYITRLVPDILKGLVAKRSKDNEGFISAITNRLHNLTQPTNRSLLEAPFSAISYQLSREDVVAINSRNRFLHGDVLLGNKQGVDQSTKEAYYMALRLYGLLAVLILKPTGYDNYIVNYAKMRENVHGKCVNEGYYILV